MFWEAEDQLVDEFSVCGAFAGFPVDYEGGETGEGEGAGAGDGARWMRSS